MRPKVRDRRAIDLPSSRENDENLSDLRFGSLRATRYISSSRAISYDTRSASRLARSSRYGLDSAAEPGGALADEARASQRLVDVDHLRTPAGVPVIAQDDHVARASVVADDLVDDP